jgi:hypothetical protein
MKTTILKGLYISATALLLVSAVVFMSYLFTGSGKVPLVDFALDFLKYLSTMVLMGGATVVVVFFIYAQSRDLYGRIFGENRSKDSQSEEKL